MIFCIFKVSLLLLFQGFQGFKKKKTNFQGFQGRVVRFQGFQEFQGFQGPADTLFHMLYYFNINTCIIATISGVSNTLTRRATLRFQLIYIKIQ